MSEVTGSESKLDADLVLIGCRIPRNWEIYCRCLWPETECTHQCGDCSGRVWDQCKESIRSRRYAQRPVSGSMGNPWRKRSRKGSGWIPDGIFLSVNWQKNALWNNTCWIAVGKIKKRVYKKYGRGQTKFAPDFPFWYKRFILYIILYNADMVKW